MDVATDMLGSYIHSRSLLKKGGAMQEQSGTFEFMSKMSQQE